MDPNKTEPASIVESAIDAKHTAATQLVEQAKAREQAQKAIRTKQLVRKITIIASIVLLVATIAAVVVLIIIAANSNSGASDIDDNPNSDGSAAELIMIDGYHCTTTLCYRVAELPDGRILIRDTAYFIFDIEQDVALKTTIKEQDYAAITPFTWGTKILAILTPATGRSALYSITNNRQAGSFNYDEFHTDPADALYADMQWIVGTYILATHANEIRLLDTFDGRELVRATSKIFANPTFFFGFETTGERRAYTLEGARIASVVADDFVSVLDKHLVIVRAASKTALEIHDSAGTKLQANDTFQRNLTNQLRGSNDYAATLRATPNIFVLSN